MKQATLEALLGRSLTSVESQNRELYLKIAKQNLEQLICSKLDRDSEARVYDVREGYSSVFVDIFVDVSEVKLDGEVVTNYTKRQFNRRDGSWYNSLVFDCRFKEGEDEVEVTADWGFDCLPKDLQLVQAGLFNVIGQKQQLNPGVASKRVEDFQITFNAAVDLDEAFYTTYGSTIDKYSICGISNIQHGGC